MNAASGDRLTESVTNQLKLFTAKDYDALFAGLSKASEAYEVARDENGRKVVPSAPGTNAPRTREVTHRTPVCTWLDRTNYASGEPHAVATLRVPPRSQDQSETSELGPAFGDAIGDRIGS